MISLKARVSMAAAICGMLLLAAGCNKKDETKTLLTQAIDAYYGAHPECLWPDSVKFPVEVATSDTSRTQGYDALVDAGLLIRIEATKKVFIFGSKQESDYDISATGRSSWTPDPEQAGYGNFCFGHRSVTSLDSIASVVRDSAPSASTTVSYHYRIAGLAPWANTDKMKNSFPSVQAALIGPAASTAALVRTNGTWAVVNAGTGSVVNQ